MAYEDGSSRLIKLDDQALLEVSRTVEDCQDTINGSLSRYQHTINELSTKLGSNNICNLTEIKKYIDVAKNDCGRIVSTVKYINDAYQSVENYNMKKGLELLGDVDKIPGKIRLQDKDGNIVNVDKNVYKETIDEVQDARRKIDQDLGTYVESRAELKEFLKNLDSKIAYLKNMSGRGRYDNDQEIAKLTKLKDEYTDRLKKINSAIDKCKDALNSADMSILDMKNHLVMFNDDFSLVARAGELDFQNRLDFYNNLNDVDKKNVSNRIDAELEKLYAQRNAINGYDNGRNTTDNTTVSLNQRIIELEDYRKYMEYLDSDQIDLYNYNVAKKGIEVGQEFLNNYDCYVNPMYASKLFKQEMEKINAMNPVEKSIYLSAKGFENGIESAFTGFAQLFQKDAIEYNVNDFRENFLQHEIAGTGYQILYDVSKGVGYMTPSLLATSALGAVLPSSVPILGFSIDSAKAVSVAGSAFMGMYVGGNSYRDALLQGHSMDEAKAYAWATGSFAAFSQAFLGGIEKLSSFGSSGAFSQKMIQNCMKESGQEFLESIVEGTLNTAILGNDFNINSAFYEGLIGGLTAGVINRSNSNIGFFKALADVDFNGDYKSAINDIKQNYTQGFLDDFNKLKDIQKNLGINEETTTDSLFKMNLQLFAGRNSDVESVLLNMLPPGLSKIESAKFLYNELNKISTYDPFFLNDKSRIGIDLRLQRAQEDYNRFSARIDSKMDCSAWAKVYEELLIDIGIPESNIDIAGKQGGHRYIVFTDPDTNMAYMADGFFSNNVPDDSYSAKLGRPSNFFFSIGPDRNSFIANRYNYNLGNYNKEFEYSNAILDMSTGYTNGRYDNGLISRTIENLKVDELFSSLRGQNYTTSDVILAKFDTVLTNLTLDYDGLTEKYHFIKDVSKQLFSEKEKALISRSWYYSKTTSDVCAVYSVFNEYDRRVVGNYKLSVDAILRRLSDNDMENIERNYISK